MFQFFSHANMESMDLYDIDLVTIDGKPQKMDDYRRKTLLIVNVASECGFTPQYEGLQALYNKFVDRGFVVLGFPVISSGTRSRAAKQRSSSSAPGTTASPSRCSQRSR